MARRTYSFDSFYENNMRKVVARGERQITHVRNKLAQQLPKETRRLFRFIDSEAIGSSQNPFTDVNPIKWKPLDRKWVKRKGHNLFWEYKSKLSAWLFNTNPNMVFGSPQISISGMMKVKDDSVRATINIDFFPRTEFNIKGAAYNRLFAKTKKALAGVGAPVSFISNDELRPIMQPGMKAFVKRHLNRKVNSIIMEALKK